MRNRRGFGNINQCRDTEYTGDERICQRLVGRASPATREGTYQLSDLRTLYEKLDAAQCRFFLGTGKKTVVFLGEIMIYE